MLEHRTVLVTMCDALDAIGTTEYQLQMQINIHDILHIPKYLTVTSTTPHSQHQHTAPYDHLEHQHCTS